MSLGRAAKISVIAVISVVVLAAAAIGYVLSIDLNQYKGEIQQAVLDATGRKLAIRGEIAVQLGLTPSVSISGVSFANAPWGSRPEMAKLDHLIVEIALPPLLQGELRVNRVVIRGVDIVLEADGKGKANWVFGPAAAKPEPADDAPPDAPDEEFTIPTVKLITVENVKLTYRDGSGAKPLVFTIEKLEGRANSAADPVTLALNGAFNGNGFSLDGSFGSIAALTSGDGWPVDVAIRAGGAKLKVKGGIGRPMQGQGVDLAFSAAGEDLSALSGLAGAQLPALGPYHVKGRLDQSGAAWRITGLEARLGNSGIEGQLVFEPKSPRPSVTVTLKSKLVDIADFRDKRRPAPSVAAAEEQETKPGDGRIFSDEKLPVGVLSALDAEVSLDVEKITADGLEISALTVRARLRGGQLKVSAFGLRVAGGGITGTAEIAAEGRAVRADLRLKITALDVGSLLRDLKITDLVHGAVDADVHLAGSGGSVRSLMAGLGGATSVIMGKGAIDSKYVNLIGADVLRTLAPWESGTKGTTVNCMVSRFKVKKGIATSETLLFDTDLVTVAGKGTIDLGAEKLDLTLVPRPKDASLISLAAPINVGGTLASPTVAPDTAAVAQKVAIGVLGGIINPLGILVPLVSAGSEDKNPCVAALKAQPQEAAPAAKKPEPKSAMESVGDAIKGVGESIGKGLKSLFGQ